jgi:type II secretory pathway pseudopilin PulG
MNKLKNKNGITLVALIITIIVLLILAMVSISLVMNSGIIDKSKTAVDKYSQEEIQEQLKLAYSEWEVARWDGTAGDATVFVRTRLSQTYGENLDESSVKVENGKVTAKINGKTFEYNTSTGTAGEIKPQALSTLTKDNYGDYIDLGQNVVGTSSTTDDWRILYNDKNGHVYAILADYLPNTDAAVTASGLHVVDNTTYNVNSSTNRDDLLSKLNSTTAWQSLIPEGLRSKCQVKGATTAEILMASYNEKYGTSLSYTSRPYLRTNPNDSSSSIDTLYMPHPGSSGYNGCYGYWLASPHAAPANYVWYVFCDGFVNDGDYYYSPIGVCPVVSLPSDIQVTKNGTVWTVVQ